MNEKEVQKLREHYLTVSDGTLLELLNGGEVGLVEGAYRLVRDEAIKRNLVVPEQVSSVSVKSEQDKNSKSSNKPSKWTYYLMIAVVFSVVKYFDSQHKLENQKKVNTSEMMKVVEPKMTDNEKITGKEVDEMLLDAMTSEERAGYLQVLDRAASGLATRQEMIENGNLINVVIERLPSKEKAIVKSFVSKFKKEHGAEILKNLGQ